MFDFPHDAFVAPETSRPLHPTMGQGVAERTYLRRVFTDLQREKLGGYGVLLNPKDPLFQKWYVAALNSDFEVDLSEEHPLASDLPETRWETWAEVAHRVALGSVSLLFAHRPHLVDSTALYEHRQMSDAIASGELLMSGRHLQQGDRKQSSRNLEVFSNCATSPTSFGLFTLLLNGSGVGRDYSDRMMVVDWAQFMPTVVAVLDESHPDFKWGKHVSRRDAQHLYADLPGVEWFPVKDSREGWGQGIDRLETVTFLNGQPETLRPVNVLILDFTAVRGENQPIMGMQGRPSSGPAPLMDAITKIDRIRGSGMKPWRAALYIDHYLAEPVLVGGARRSARMSTKWWQDADIFDFISVKRPVEFTGMSPEEVEAYIDALAAEGRMKPLPFLWSSNNSVAVDKDFWARVHGPITNDPLTMKAKLVYAAATNASYGDGTGEPGFINVDRLAANDNGLDAEDYVKGQFFGSLKYQITGKTEKLLESLYEAFVQMPYHYITNPCGEIALLILGGFCVIADVVPCHSDSPDRAIDVARIAVRALMRVNMMDSVYRAEVARTNRIGVGVTGIHEAAWKFFQIGFADMVNPNFDLYGAELRGGEIDPAKHCDGRVRAAAFWDWLGRMGAAIREESESYAEVLGVAVPHTCTTVKPSGSVSKLFGLSEGWHLPALRHYLRWVQYHKNSPMIEDYRAKGYPIRELKTYADHFIVGFPTEPAIVAMGIGDKLVTAGEASMTDQFTWLRLGEFFLIEGFSFSDYILFGGSLDAAIRSRGFMVGNQISYTMKYKPGETSLYDFQRVISRQQPGVRCVSVMPQTNASSYEYLPEEQVSVAEYQGILAAIQREEGLSEDVGLEHLDCSTGACPIVFNPTKKEDL